MSALDRDCEVPGDNDVAGDDAIAGKRALTDRYLCRNNEVSTNPQSGLIVPTHEFTFKSRAWLQCFY
jgi:hypothetical protein